MAEFQRQVGQPLRLNLAFDDGSSDHFVRCFLRDETGAPLATPFVNLAHVGNGEFIDNTVAMPNAAQVKAKYVVYSDAGYTVKDLRYSEGFDTFDKQELVPVQFPDDEVEGVVSDGSRVSASLQEGAISGIVEQDGAVGTLEVDQASGVLDQSDVAGSLEEAKVEGEIEC